MSKERHKQQQRKSRTSRVMGFIQLPICTIFAQVKLSVFSADKNCICQGKSSALRLLQMSEPRYLHGENRCLCRLCPCLDSYKIWKAIRSWNSAFMQQNSSKCYHKEKMMEILTCRVKCSIAEAFQQAGLLINLGEKCATELFHLRNFNCTTFPHRRSFSCTPTSPTAWHSWGEA